MKTSLGGVGVCFCFLCAAYFYGYEARGQTTDYGRNQLGVYLMTGNSAGIIPSQSPLNNQINDLRRGFVGTGFYCFLQLRSDSIYNTPGFLRFMKVDFGFSNRSGIFEMTNGSAASVNTQGADVAVLLPFSFGAAREIDAYIAAGPVASYRYNWYVTPAQQIPDENVFGFGYAVEMGFRLRSGSAIGYRAMGDASGDYRYRVGAIFFGFSPQAPKKTVGRK